MMKATARCFFPKVVICHAVRTPIGRIGGGLSSFTAPRLLEQVVKFCVETSKVDPKQIEFIGCGWVNQDPRGAAMAETAARKAGCPDSVPGTLVHEQCSSGAVAVHNIARQIRLGEISLALGCGVECMSNIPRHLYTGRLSGVTYGPMELRDGLMDGLTDFEFRPGGVLVGALTDEFLCAKYKVTREFQDEVAYRSHHNACDAWDQGFYDNTYIMSIDATKKGAKKQTIVNKDEGCRRVTREELAKAKPYFIPKGGSVTAANASQVSDGAACVLLASEEKAKELGLPILAELIAWDRTGCPRELFGEGAFKPLPRVLAKAGKKMADVDYFEMNEAFAAVVGAALNDPEMPGKIPFDKVNRWGSGVALGHPVGCTGVRQMVDMVHQLRKRNAWLGYTGRCAGGGKGTGELLLRRE